jgi:hypothetical protein
MLHQKVSSHLIETSRFRILFIPFPILTDPSPFFPFSYLGVGYTPIHQNSPNKCNAAFALAVLFSDKKTRAQQKIGKKFLTLGAGYYARTTSYLYEKIRFPIRQSVN